jgi:sortase A
MKKIGFVLLFFGLLLISVCSYLWFQERQISSHYQVDKAVEQSPMVEKKVHFQTGDQIAELVIPSIQQIYPVFLGTEPDVLKRGAGMVQSEWTTFPTEKGHTVISGHRDTIFRDLRFVKEGETLQLLFQGQQYEYQVQKIWITDKEDRSVITKKEQPVLTLTTCYPFYFVGNAPKRYIIEATLKNTNNVADITR